MASAARNLSLEKQVAKGVEVLRRGGVVAFPTDTVYGLGARADDERAVARIFEIKQRARDMALPLLISDEAHVDQIAISVPDGARRLMRRYWPGPLTIILPRAASVPDIITGGKKGVAARVPDHPVALALIRGLGKPVVGTSANLSGRPAAATAAEVLAQLGDRVDLVIDGGKAPLGRESTVVDFTGEVPVLVREGAVPVAELRQIVGEVRTRPCK